MMRKIYQEDIDYMEECIVSAAQAYAQALTKEVTHSNFGLVRLKMLEAGATTL